MLFLPIEPLYSPIGPIGGPYRAKNRLLRGELLSLFLRFVVPQTAFLARIKPVFCLGGVSQEGGVRGGTVGSPPREHSGLKGHAPLGTLAGKGVWWGKGRLIGVGLWWGWRDNHRGARHRRSASEAQALGEPPNFVSSNTPLKPCYRDPLPASKQAKCPRVSENTP